VDAVLALVGEAATRVDGVAVLIGDALLHPSDFALVACLQELLLLLLHGVQVLLPNALQQAFYFWQLSVFSQQFLLDFILVVVDFQLVVVQVLDDEEGGVRGVEHRLLDRTLGLFAVRGLSLLLQGGESEFPLLLSLVQLLYLLEVLHLLLSITPNTDLLNRKPPPPSSHSSSSLLPSLHSAPPFHHSTTHGSIKLMISTCSPEP
jgi:hypothetical protein